MITLLFSIGLPLKVDLVFLFDCRLISFDAERYLELCHSAHCGIFHTTLMQSPQ